MNAATGGAGEVLYVLGKVAQWDETGLTLEIEGGQAMTFVLADGSEFVGAPSHAAGEWVSVGYTQNKDGTLTALSVASPE